MLTRSRSPGIPQMQCLLPAGRQHRWERARADGKQLHAWRRSRERHTLRLPCASALQNTYGQVCKVSNLDLDVKVPIGRAPPRQKATQAAAPLRTSTPRRLQNGLQVIEIVVKVPFDRAEPRQIKMLAVAPHQRTSATGRLQPGDHTGYRLGRPSLKALGRMIRHAISRHLQDRSLPGTIGVSLYNSQHA